MTRTDTLEDAILVHMDATPAITSLIASRVFAQTLPQGTALPAATIARLNTRPVHLMGDDSGLEGAVVEFSTWDIDYDSAKAAMLAIVGAFRRFSGTVAGVAIQDVFVRDLRDLHSEEGGEGGVHHIVAELEFWAA